MKAIYTTRDGRIQFHLDVETPKAMFRELAGIQGTFDAEDSCGNCRSTDISFCVRKAKNGKGAECEYFELRCEECGAQFSFGQSTDNATLFPKRRDGANQLPNGGWSVYQGKGGGAPDDEDEWAGRRRTAEPPRQSAPPATQQRTPMPSGKMSANTFDAKIATHLEAISKDAGNAGAAFQFCLDALERFGSSGTAAYEEIAAEFERKHKSSGSAALYKEYVRRFQAAFHVLSQQQ